MNIKNKLPFVAFVLIVCLCCFMQILSICELFFSFPTVILSEVNFDVTAIPVPTMTFCINTGNGTFGKTSEEIFNKFNVSEIIGSFEYTDVESGKSDNIFRPDQVLLSLSMKYSCITLNHIRKGEFSF